MFLFKKIYNLSCTLEKQKDNENTTGKIYQIGNDDLDKYDLNICINDNISYNNCRDLLLEIKSYMAPLINQIIRAQNSYRKDTDTIIGSPFSDNKNKKSLLSILEKGSTDNYVITEDNNKKMVLLVYRIKVNVPVIIMGEIGGVKTSLIIKLSLILNNGEKLVEKLIWRSKEWKI